MGSLISQTQRMLNVGMGSHYGDSTTHPALELNCSLQQKRGPHEEQTDHRRSVIAGTRRVPHDAEFVILFGHQRGNSLDKANKLECLDVIDDTVWDWSVNESSEMPAQYNALSP